jgi:hypothetical protein
MIIRIVALLLLSSLVFAQAPVQKTFTWIPPTEREPDANGFSAPLPDDEIASYKIYCDGVSAPIWEQTNQPGADERWEAPAGSFALGSHSCHATTIDTGGRESGPSNTVHFTVTLANPKPPVFVLQ